MMNKLKYLINISLKRKIKTKWFLVANVLLCIVIVGLINIDSVIKVFGGDFGAKQIIYVTDNTNKVYNVLVNQNDNYASLFQKSDEKSNFVLKKSKDDVNDILKNDKNAWILVLDDDKNVFRAKLVSNGYISVSDYTEFSNILNNTKSTIALAESTISSDELKRISSPVKIDREVLDESQKSEDEQMQMMLETIFPVFVLPFFALTILLVQMIGAEVNDEKTTRGMEIIISNVSPKVHLISKIVASNLFVLLQGVLLVVFAGVGLILRLMLGKGVNVNFGTFNVSSMVNNFFTSDIASQLGYIIPLTLLMMVLTFIAYSLLAGVLASMTTNIEDFQQLQTPIMIISLVGYYLSIMAGVFEGSLFIKIFAFVPFISAVLAPCLLVLGQFSVIEFVIAIILVVLVIYLLIKYGFRIYKQGILNYSSQNLWKKMFKAMKSE